jgi:hypothetical protein
MKIVRRGSCEEDGREQENEVYFGRRECMARSVEGGRGRAEMGARAAEAADVVFEASTVSSLNTSSSASSSMSKVIGKVRIWK